MRVDTSPPPLRVLVVDDDREMTDALALLLEFWGFSSVVAYDGPAALQAAAAARPDVAVLDLGLPGMDGWEVAVRLREQAGTEATPLIALTGSGHDADRGRSRNAGFDHHLVKPVDPRELRGLLAGYEEAAECAGARRAE